MRNIAFCGFVEAEGACGILWQAQAGRHPPDSANLKRCFAFLLGTACDWLLPALQEQANLIGLHAVGHTVGYLWLNLLPIEVIG